MTILRPDQVEHFIANGYAHLEAAFPRDLARRCVDELWAATGLDRDSPDSWVEPVIRVEGSAAPPLVAAINAPRLVGALDDLLGAGRWQRRTGYGTFPVRFPSERDPGDAGWHVDGAYEAGDRPPPWNYHLNFWSRGRALLLLMLYSDVGPDDAPTRIRAGSHLEVARVLRRFGPDGASFVDATTGCDAAEGCAVVHATGQAGDVFLCHPFLVHAATWPHRSLTPRFLGQPAILHAGDRDGFDYDRDDRGAPEIAVLRAVSTG